MDMAAELPLTGLSLTQDATNFRSVIRRSLFPLDLRTGDASVASWRPPPPPCIGGGTVRSVAGLLRGAVEAIAPRRGRGIFCVAEGVIRVLRSDRQLRRN